MPKIPLEIKDSSSDKEVIKARITKLTYKNWVQWSCQFKNYLISKGMDDLLDPPSEDVKKTTKFKKRNGGALTLLWSSAKSSKSKGKNQSEGGHKKKGFKEKKKGKNNSKGTGRGPTQEQDTKKPIERIDKLLEQLQSSTNLTSLNAASESKELNCPSETDSEAFIFDKVNAMIGKNHQRLIYLDSGAGRTIVNDLTLLDNPTPVLKHINTFLNPVKVSHQGTLVFKGVKLYHF
ncbi:hypothetical protein O181_009777 [Austropuccinia psidii MF-1]|uniref:Uncharacterized protein n=1 Tax=Austropuccinia psidii MF-1 TaxID=1389203 RepID=A0A9Q3BRC8_9BASI|nr:hypothetical protein [Austropuccinia psidii MF-1]